MRIVADENIPYVKEAFSSIGEVITLPGRNITKETLKNTHILLVRSITRVDRELLEGSSLRIVATATIGTDHLDKEYLNKRGIHYASAPGSNANSVAEYVVAALLSLSEEYNFTMTGKTIAVIGVGNVGSRVVNKVEALGLKVLQNDPPLARKTGKSCYLPIEEVLDSDIVTLHVPLTYEGEDATFHMVSEQFILRMKRGAILINASRGKIVDESALHRAIDANRLKSVVLDVWENEPEIDVGLLKKVNIGTPHIAGYSFDGKVKGTEMIYRAVCEFLGRKPSWIPRLPPSPNPEVRIETTQKGSFEPILHKVIRTVYDIEADEAKFRGILDVPHERRGQYFDSLRKNYPVRREFYNTKVICNDSRLRGIFHGLGFQVDSPQL
ncbi:MAG TPA: 4-phosphoerythronate dehydrogenase [Candidatus Omnitrophica bacterium]|nr:4-phosphoerythronate dehydrogenase [Candidatus Omnitrophota bacterium]